MIKLIVIFILILLNLYFYCKISNKESFSTYVSERHCVDDCLIVKKVDNTVGTDWDLESISKETITNLVSECRKKCEGDCKKNNCNYVEVLNLKKNPPEKIKNEKVDIQNDYIRVSWFKPKTSKEHPILRYICIIENLNDKSIEFEIPNISNNDLMEHYFRGLKKGEFYNIKIYSENDNGISNPIILRRLSLKEKVVTEVRKKKEVKLNTRDSVIDESVYGKLLGNDYVKSAFLKVLSPLF